MRGLADAFVRGYDKSTGEDPARWELRLRDALGMHSVVKVSRAADGGLRAESLGENWECASLPEPRSEPVRRAQPIGVEMKGYSEKRHLFRKAWEVVLRDEEGKATEVSLVRLKNGLFIAVPTGGRADSGSQS